jgi:hypothetical protein
MQGIKVKLLRETETAAVVLIGETVRIFSKCSQIYNQLVRNLISR